MVDTGYSKKARGRETCPLFGTAERLKYEKGKRGRKSKEIVIPLEIKTMDVNDYEDFLVNRRKLMGKLVQKYYEKL